MITRTRRNVVIALAAVLATSGLALASPTAALAVTCPTVDLVTKAVTPAASSGVDWSGCDLTGADLTSGALAGASLDSTNLTSARLVATALNGADLTRATLTGVFSQGITGTPASLPTSWHLVNGYLLGQGADLTGATLTGLDLSNFNLTDANLTHADLGRTKFINAVLIATNFSYVTASDADFTRANLDGSTFDYAQIDYTSFVDARLTSAQMNNANLNHANLTYINGRGATLTFSSLENATLNYATLYAADLRDASLKGALVALDSNGDSLTNLNAVTWGNTTCIDGTISDTHDGRTCLGNVDTRTPTAFITSPAAPFQSASGFRVAWSGSDRSGSGIHTYTVQVSKNGAAFTTHPPWAATTGTSGNYPGTAGDRLCFRVKATDYAGNVQTAFSASKCTVVPIDDHSLSKSSGWSSSTSASGYLNRTYYSTTSSNKYLITTSSKSGVRQVSVLALKCSSCGSIAVYVGSTKIGTYSLKKSGSSARGLVTTARFSSKSGKVKVVSTISGKTVRIDGVGISTS